MFRTVPLSIVSSFSLYTQQWCMSYRFSDSLQAGSGRPDPACKLSENLYDIYQCCVQWKTPDDGQRNCPKHVEFDSKNKFEKLVHLVGFIIRIYHDARSRESQMHLHYITQRTSLNLGYLHLYLYMHSFRLYSQHLRYVPT